MESQVVLVAVKLPRSMARELRLAAAYAETSMSEVHRRALAEYLSKNKPTRQVEAVLERQPANQ